jgi:hypothetical protein
MACPISLVNSIVLPSPHQVSVGARHTEGVVMPLKPLPRSLGKFGILLSAQQPKHNGNRADSSDDWYLDVTVPPLASLGRRAALFSDSPFSLAPVKAEVGRQGSQEVGLCPGQRSLETISPFASTGRTTFCVAYPAAGIALQPCETMTAFAERHIAYTCRREVKLA